MPTTLYESPSGNPVVIPDLPVPPAKSIAREAYEVLALGAQIVLTDSTPTVLQDGATPFDASLVVPDMMMHYSAEAEFDVVYYGGNPNPNNAALQVDIQVSIDNGAYTTVASSVSELLAPQDTGGTSSRRMKGVLKSTLGSALGVIAGTTSLKVRARLICVFAGGSSPQTRIQSNSTGNTTLKLTERRP